MDRYAVIYEETKQVLFHFPLELAKRHTRFIKQLSTEEKTLKSLENKFKVKIEWQKMPEHQNCFGYYVKE